MIWKIQLLMLVYTFLWLFYDLFYLLWQFSHTWATLSNLYVRSSFLRCAYTLNLSLEVIRSTLQRLISLICIFIFCVFVFFYKSVSIEWTEHLSLFDEISLRCSAMTQTLWKAGRLLRLSADALWGVMAFSCSHSSSSHFVFDVACLPYPRALKV